MKIAHAFLLAATVFAIAACTTTPQDDKTTTFVIVRHAEKNGDASSDPALSEAGKARARALAALLAHTPLVAAYATAYQRTQQTARPAAEAHHVRVTTYDAQLSAREFASRLRAAHQGGTILVVGHSNTAPDIVSALSGQATAPMSDEEFGRLYRVTIGVDGKATLNVDHY